MLIQGILWTCIFISGSLSRNIFTFIEICQFFKGVISFYMPTNRVWKFQLFSHPHDIRYFHYSLFYPFFRMWNGTSLSFWFAFHWRVMMLNLLICILLKSNDVKPLWMFCKHLFSCCIYSVINIPYSSSQLGPSQLNLSCSLYLISPQYLGPGQLLHVILNYHICVFMLFTYLLVYRYHKIKNLAYLIYHYIPHVKIGA